MIYYHPRPRLWVASCRLLPLLSPGEFILVVPWRISRAMICNSSLILGFCPIIPGLGPLAMIREDLPFLRGKTATYSTITPEEAGVVPIASGMGILSLIPMSWHNIPALRRSCLKSPLLRSFSAEGGQDLRCCRWPGPGLCTQVRSRIN